MVMEWIRSKLRAPEPESGHLLGQAENAYREGALEQARRCCQAVLRHSQSNVRALSLLASIAADRREIDEGMQRRRSITRSARQPVRSVGDHVKNRAGFDDRTDDRLRVAAGVDG